MIIVHIMTLLPVSVYFSLCTLQFAPYSHYSPTLLGLLVLGSIVGSLIGTNLLLPGTAMLAGGWKRKTQTFNVRSTGVTTTLLITSLFICTIPTVFYSFFGTRSLACEACPICTKGGRKGGRGRGRIMGKGNMFIGYWIVYIEYCVLDSG